MVQEQGRDILENARQFHQQLSKFFAGISSGVQGNTPEHQRVKMLLDYLSAHQEHLGGALEAYAEDADKEVTDTWFKNAPVIPPLEKLDIKAETLLGVNDVICLSVHCQALLVDLYRQAAERAHEPAVSEVFGKLADRMERIQHNLVRDGMRVEDL